MKKIIYYTRVIVLSFEFIFLLLSVLFNTHAINLIENALTLYTLNNDAYEYMIILPIGLFAWMVNEVTPIILPNEKVNSYLHKWEYIWKLKAHIYVGLLYSALSLTVCLGVWLVGGASIPKSIFLLFVALAVQISSATSFLLARVEISSILARASE